MTSFRCPHRLVGLCILLAASFGICPLSIASHESLDDWPSAEQLAGVKPAFEFSLPFAQQLLAHFRGKLNARQLELLDEVQRNIQVMQRVDAGYLGGERIQSEFHKSQVVQFYRWQTERSLLRLLNSIESTQIVEFDMTEGDANAKLDEIIKHDPRQGRLLIRFCNGATDEYVDRYHFVTDEWDLIRERPEGPFAVDVGEQGTTYLLLDLVNLPQETSIAHIAFRSKMDRRNLLTHALTFQSPPHGQLAIDVVDGDGESTPVLMSIASPTTGELWEPAEAVDLRSVFNDVVPHLNSTGRGYTFYLPGNRRGRYWVVKPPLEMSIPEGEWEIRVLRGLEFVPIHRKVSVSEGDWTRVELRPERWTNMQQLGWYSGDDHIHAQLMSSEDARKLIGYARAVDINVSNILEMGDVMRTYYAQRGFGKEFRVQHGEHWLIPGQEDPRSVLGHAIGLNLQSKVRDLDRYLANDWIAAEIHRQGGLYGHTHVGANACFVHREMALFTPHGIVDFNSIMQADLGLDLYYDFLNLGYQMTASAGADTPYGGTVGAVRTYAFTGNPQHCSPDEWFQALKQGRTFVTNGPMIDLKVEDAMPGDEIVTENNRTLKVTARTWGEANSSAPVELKIVVLGETRNRIVASDESQNALEIEDEIEVGYGCWIAAHVIGRDGSQAHTTPVYVRRDGFRHWNVERAAGLIQKQLAVLDEIETEVRSAELLYKSGRANLDYWSRRTAEQADEVRKRIDETRAIYEQLRASLEDQINSGHVE